MHKIPFLLKRFWWVKAKGCHCQGNPENIDKRTTQGDLKDFDLFNLWKQGVKRGSDCSNYIREGKQSFKPNGNTRTKTKLHEHHEDGNSATARDFKEVLQQLSHRDGERIHGSSFTLEEVVLWKASTAWMGAKNRETKLDLGCCHSFWSEERDEELPPPATLPSASSPSLRDSTGGIHTVYSGTSLGYDQGTKLGSWSLTKSMVRGGCLGSSRGKGLGATKFDA